MLEENIKEVSNRYSEYLSIVAAAAEVINVACNLAAVFDDEHFDDNHFDGNLFDDELFDDEHFDKQGKEKKNFKLCFNKNKPALEKATQREEKNQKEEKKELSESKRDKEKTHNHKEDNKKEEDNTNKENRTNKKRREDSNLEDGLDDEIAEDNILDKTSPDVNYSFHEEQLLAGNFYKSPLIDYVRMFYGDTGKRPPVFASDEEYSAAASDVERECLTMGEAAKAMKDIQYAIIAGAAHDVSLKQRQKFDMWIKFNPSLFKMMESLYSVTSEINYSILT